MKRTVSIFEYAIRTRGGKWHRGGVWDYPGDRHCPVGLGLVLMPRGTESDALANTEPADRCRRCFREES